MALFLVKKTVEVLTEAEITVSYDAVEWSVIEAIDPEQLPGDGPWQVRQIENTSSQPVLQLGKGQTIGEAVEDIRNRISQSEQRV